MQVVNQTTRYYATYLPERLKNLNLTVSVKRIIVIPAVYQLLASLKRGFKYWHWADVAFHTHLFRLAKSGVFVKQTGPSSQ